MCNALALAAATAVVGAGMSYRGQQQQASEYKRANNERAAHNAAAKQLANRQRDDELKFSKEKNDSIIAEAETVAPDRVDLMKKEEDQQTASNVKALTEANLLGDDSLIQTGEGDHSEAYVKSKAEAAAKQSENAIKMARLFGAQTSGNAAIANQNLAAIDHRLDQQAIDARRRSMQRGYDWMFHDLSQSKADRTTVNPGKGSGASALGNLGMNLGMNYLGSQAGGYFGNNQASANINNLF